MKKILMVLFLLVSISLFSCSMSHGEYSPLDGYSYSETDQSGDESHEIVENRFVEVSEKATSNISLSPNTAAYSALRNNINNGRSIDKNLVRIEEMINYFKFDYNEPTGEDIFGVNSYVIENPWNSETSLLIMGMRAKEIEVSDTPNNLVFLIDTSGSMNYENKLPLVQQSFGLLLEQLKPNDYVSIVTYASSDKVILKGARGDEQLKIEAAISDLYASGSTAGSKGIQTAYEIAQEYFIEGGNNRVILATDGDFNVGISSTSQLENFISEKKDTGIYLSCLGFGYGNHKDNKLESLAKKGNGNYAYIDTILEAKKALVEDINGTLYTIARDSKAQIDFSDSKVLEYRLIGYENRQLTDDEFNDSNTDAGEIDMGHQVTSIYEIKINEELGEGYGTLKIRYKDPDINNNDQLEQIYDITNASNVMANEDCLFISAIVEFGLILRESKYKGSASLDSIIERIENLESVKSNPYKKDFVDLVKKYQTNYNG